jgi:hypothetical protein
MKAQQQRAIGGVVLGMVGTALHPMTSQQQVVVVMVGIAQHPTTSSRSYMSRRWTMQDTTGCRCSRQGRV